MTLVNPGLQIHGLVDDSRVNGPGRRAVVHLQGCTLGCGGCFNPETHDAQRGRWVAVEALVERLLQRSPEGVTISGGEPFQQPEGLGALCEALRARGVSSVLVFSGYALDELTAMPAAEVALANVDVLVAGRYVAQSATEGQLTSSANQRVHCLTERHGPEEFGGGSVEISILDDGRVVMTGFPDPGLRRAMRAMAGE